jgi:hypothetical protein
VDLTETGCVYLDWFQLAHDTVTDLLSSMKAAKSTGKVSNFKLPKRGSVISESLLIRHVHVGRYNLLHSSHTG